MSLSNLPFLAWTVVMLVRRCVQLARAAARLPPGERGAFDLAG